MSYTTGPYARYTTLPVPDRPTASSARNIDFTTLRYTIDSTTGGFERMPPVVQRVMLLILNNVPEPRLNTEQELTAIKQSIEASLAILTAAPNPQIELKEVTVVRDFAGSARRNVVFTDLTRNTGNDITVQV